METALRLQPGFLRMTLRTSWSSSVCSSSRPSTQPYLEMSWIPHPAVFAPLLSILWTVTTGVGLASDCFTLGPSLPLACWKVPLRRVL